MFTVNSVAIVAAAAAMFSSCAIAFDASANTNMAVYWGQGDGQQRLAHYCEDSSIDIIPIGFLNVFPDQAGGGYPGTNFANQCGSATYTNLDGSKSPLLSDCPLIGPDIITCQNAGKKILLSLGGANPNNQAVKDDASAVEFATFLWNAFGPKNPAYTGPRPFGDAVVDGFDFDIETSLSAVSDSSALGRGYATMVNTLRSFYALEKKTYYISSAPQCIVPDVHLADAIQKSYFDFIFVQFYNTPQCSARAFFDHTYGAYGGPATDISFHDWASLIRSSSKNPNAKIYLGLPASTAKTYDAKMYIEPSEVSQLISKFQCDYPENFGGLMVYEATSSELNSIDGKPYAENLKRELVGSNCAKKPSTTSALPTPTSASVTTSSQSSTSVSTTSSSSSVPTSSSQSSTSASTTSSSTSSSLTSSASTTSSQSSTSVSISSSSAGSSANSTTTSASLSMPSYTSGSGFYNSTTEAGPTAPLSPTGSTPFMRSSSSATYNTTSFTKSVGTGASVPLSTFATGASGSSSLSLGPSSNAPYPANNSTTSQPTATRGIMFTTEVITITSCGPEVTSCPARLSTTVRPVTTSTPGSGKVTSSGSSSSSAEASSTSTNNAESGTTGPSSSSAASTLEASPTPGSSSVQGVVTTEIVYTTLTTCPVTQTVTSSGRPVTQTTLTVSTIYSTSTSTICTRCIASHTSSLTPPGTPATSTKSAPATNPSSSDSSSSAAAPVTSAPASTQAVVTTEIVYTTVTTCPVTKTLTSSGSTLIQTIQSVSTVISTSVSTICTKCVAPTSNAPVSTSSGVSTPAQSPSSALFSVPSSALSSASSSASSASTSGNSPGQASNFVTAQTSTGTNTRPVTSTLTVPASSTAPSASTSGNSPVQASNSVTAQTSTATNTRPVTLTLPVPASSQAPSSVSGITSSGPSSSSASVVTMTVSPVPLNPSQTAKIQGSASTASETPSFASVPAVSPTSTASGTSPVASVSAVGPASTASGSSPVASISSVSPATIASTRSPSSVVPVSTMVIVPVPLNPSQTAKPVNGAPFLSGNATSPLGASARVSASSSIVPSASGSQTLPTNPAQFTGAASKMHMGVTGVVMIVAAAVFFL